MYVLAPSWPVFRSFCHEFSLKIDLTGQGHGVSLLTHETLSGLGHNNIVLVAYDGMDVSEALMAEVKARCEYQDIPLVYVPDLGRARYQRMKHHVD